MGCDVKAGFHGLARAPPVRVRPVGFLPAEQASSPPDERIDESVSAAIASLRDDTAVSVGWDHRTGISYWRSLRVGTRSRGHEVTRLSKRWRDDIYIYIYPGWDVSPWQSASKTLVAPSSGHAAPGHLRKSVNEGATPARDETTAGCTNGGFICGRIILRRGGSCDPSSFRGQLRPPVSRGPADPPPCMPQPAVPLEIGDASV